MPHWVETLITVLCAFTASSGFWAYMIKKAEKKDGKTKLLLGIAHDRIVYLGMLYIDQGSITQDEFENLDTYLYTPYHELGGNGTTTRIMDEVRKLPIKRTIPSRTNGSVAAQKC